MTNLTHPQVSIQKELTKLAVGVVYAHQIRVGLAPSGLTTKIRELCQLIDSGEVNENSKAKQSTRALLKHGKFRATGRGKPAHEYLWSIAKEEGSIHLINNIVDINNFVSIKTQLPISVFDLKKCESPFVLRHGQPGEKYIFNQSGQEIDLQDLLLVSDHGGKRAIGNPVKDSMLTKVFDDATSVLYIIYANKEYTSKNDLTIYTELLSELLVDYAYAETPVREILGYA